MPEGAEASSFNNTPMVSIDGSANEAYTSSKKKNRLMSALRPAIS
jgi:hypothetical protein